MIYPDGFLLSAFSYFFALSYSFLKLLTGVKKGQLFLTPLNITVYQKIIDQ